MKHKESGNHSTNAASPITIDAKCCPLKHSVSDPQRRVPTNSAVRGMNRMVEVHSKAVASTCSGQLRAAKARTETSCSVPSVITLDEELGEGTRSLNVAPRAMMWPPDRCKLDVIDVANSHRNRDSVSSTTEIARGTEALSSEVKNRSGLVILVISLSHVT